MNMVAEVGSTVGGDSVSVGDVAEVVDQLPVGVHMNQTHAAAAAS
jgi:hypothetical protein